MLLDEAMITMDDGIAIIDDLSMKDAWQTIKAAVLAQQANNNARDEICPYYIRTVKTGLGILHICNCQGKIIDGQTSPVA
jgi:hypothetical protein